MNKKNALKCNYCDKICTGGITRIKFHLACIRRNGVARCLKVSVSVKKEYLTLLTQKSEAKVKKSKEATRVRAEIDLDYSQGEGEERSSHEDCCTDNDVVLLNSIGGSSSNSRADVGGPMDKFCMPSVEESVKKSQKGINAGNKVQTMVSTQKREEKRDRAVEYIC